MPGSSIARNTIILYLRMIVVIVINFYVSRLLLKYLGVVDYGIYNVVGGIIVVFSFLNNAMIASSQRFIAFEQGHSDIDRQIRTFSTSVLIHLLISLVIVLAAETFGLWLLNEKMNIDPERMCAARWVFQCAILSFVFKVISVPYSSTVVAHEKMDAYAAVSIVDAVLQLASVILLKNVLYDKLIFYSILVVVIAGTDWLIYLIYCKNRFEECVFRKPSDSRLLKEMLVFSGWSFLGNFGIAAKGSGVNIIINIFFGAAVNAARGLAYQVSSVVSNFVNNFQTAITPQITKRYAAGEIDSMLSLVRSSCKLSMFLLSIVVIPLYIRAPYVLDFWLDEVPEMTLEFLRLALLMSMVGSFVGPLTTSLQATGDIKVFQILIAIIMTLDLPLAYLMFSIGGVDPYEVMYIAISTEVVALLVRIILVDKQLKIGFASFMKEVIAGGIIVFILMFSLPYVLDKFVSQTFVGLVGITFISIIWSALVFYFLGLNKVERKVCLHYVKSVLHISE